MLFQSDFGLTYDSSVVATAGNTSTTAITIANSGSTAPCAVRAKATNSLAIGSGGQFSIYTDGGTTPIMTAVTPTAATPIALTGFSGVTLSWSAGTVVNNDTWDAAAAAWTDQAASPHNASSSGGTRPIITPGTGGKLGTKGNGTNTRFTTSLGALAAPATTNQYMYVLARMLSTPAGNASICSIPGGTSFGIYC
ncbi:MAG: hypothetical protein H0X36_14925, partial [Sphingomonadaceae bacterium]|nr:hypothetical protein [Sphingomonadaceae bacterium]